MTPLVATFTVHFAATLLHVERPPMRSRLVALVVGVVAVLVGLPTGARWLVAAGATVASVAVLSGYRLLWRIRSTSVGARFGFVVRAYERAHGAFVHGALLGAVMGASVLPGDWYVAVRSAHLHVTVLGRAGLTLLATVVFLGPTVFRVRIADGAEASSARALRWGATAVTFAALPLLGSGVGGTSGAVLRVAAGLALVVLTSAVIVVVRPVVRLARGAERSLSTLLLRHACWWFAAGPPPTR
ncbi:MAG TPA: hypothetical protein VHF25_08265 [Nitriliruptorales bacterium]|nr:hypothetical protein [Nitriliruptorales bacterium]